MTYRNDHDAAVARVDALQHEVARLADENATLRETPRMTAPVRRWPAAAFAATLLAAIGGTFIGFATGTAEVNSHPTIAAPLPPPIVVEATDSLEASASIEAKLDLEACARAIHRDLSIPDAKASIDTAVLERTGAACRIALRKVAAADGASDELRGWSDAEADLGNRISMLVVYYSSNPALLDGYETAPRLWNEYGEMMIARNAAVARWERTH